MVLFSGLYLNDAYAEIRIENGVFSDTQSNYGIGSQIYFANHESIDLEITTSLGNGTATAGNSFMIIPTECGDISFTIEGMGSGIIDVPCPESPEITITGDIEDLVLEVYADTWSGCSEQIHWFITPDSGNLYDIQIGSDTEEFFTNPDETLSYDEIEYDRSYRVDATFCGIEANPFTRFAPESPQQDFTVSIENGTEIPGTGDTIIIHVVGAQGTVNIDIVTAGAQIDSLSIPASSEGIVQTVWLIPSHLSSGTYTIDASDSFNSDFTTFVIDNNDPVFDTETFSVEVDNLYYSVKVTTENINVQNIEPDLDFNSIIIPIEVSSSYGVLEIELIREFLDSTFQNSDKEFIVMVDGDNPEFDEIQTSSSMRTLEIQLEPGNEEIEIIGTKLGNNETDEEPTPEEESITVRTTRSSYENGENVLVLGNISSDNYYSIVTFLILSPENDIVAIGQIPPDSDGAFSHEFTVGGPLWKIKGDYEFQVKYGSLSASTEFEFEGGEIVTPNPEPEPPYHSEVTITTVSGSGAPGCEETAEGCYTPSTASVSVGGVVIMKNTDTAAHTFTSGDPSIPDSLQTFFDTGLIMSGSSYEWSPDADGEYPYFCMVHPWMEGRIIVGEGGNVPTPTKINVNTDRNSYHLGDELKISGTVYPSNNSIILEIFNPSGNLLYLENTSTSSSGVFTEQIKLSGNNYKTTGSYTVKAISGSTTTETQFLIKSGTPDDVPPPNTNPQNEVTIEPTAGSGAPGCEETSQGCYLPSVASVTLGGVVIMKNTDTTAHTFTSGVPSIPDSVQVEFDSGLLMSGSSYEWSPTTEGVIDYFCMVHPWMTGVILVGEGTLPPPTPEPKDNIDLEIQIEKRVYDINTVAVLNISLSGNSEPQNVAIEVTDPRDTTVISRSTLVDSDISFEFKIDENFKPGNYQVTATTSDGTKTVKDTTHFKVKSQFNSFKITSVQVTDQKGNPSDLEAGEIGFIKVNLESNKSISTLVTVNIFDSELSSIGIGSVNTTLSSGNSEIILSFMIPDDVALGSADIYVNAFSDWPSNGGVPLTNEVSIVEDIE